MTGDRPGADIRVARHDEYEALRAIERASEQLFLDIGIGPFSESEEENHLERAAVVFVSGEPPVGFACVEVVDGDAHLWQLSVLPQAGRQGRGTALVGAVCRWAASQGLAGVTLTTFADVAWNGPFYARLGFAVVDSPSSGLAAIRAHEKEIGDDAFGPRVAMRKPVA
ncbi:MAG TPA: GNAT family N-acetyltransferase [Acidimicrobiales bacterium]|nr:GNAT family N-acetyltransferase [Acidimicrobiales bacterium]